MSTKAKHAKSSQYRSHDYKAFPMFIRNAYVRQNAFYVTSHATKQKKTEEES